MEILPSSSPVGQNESLLVCSPLLSRGKDPLVVKMFVDTEIRISNQNLNECLKLLFTLVRKKTSDIAIDVSNEDPDYKALRQSESKNENLSDTVQVFEDAGSDYEVSE